MSILINGLIKWREEKMERAGAGLSGQWQRRKGEGWKLVEVGRLTAGEVDRFWQDVEPIQIPLFS